MSVSSSLPTKHKTLLGLIVFSGAMGTPKLSHIVKNLDRFCSQAEKVLSMRRKSSKRCKTPEIANLDLAIHLRAVEKLSQILQEELAPIGRHLQNRSCPPTKNLTNHSRMDLLELDEKRF